MSRKTKRIFFYSAVAVFLLLSYVVLLYAQGYKYSFSEGKFQRTGAISLKINTGAKVFLDDKLEGNSSFFNNSFSIDRLLPGRYELLIQKDDYSIWKKTVTVEEGFVTDFPNALILPEEGEKEQELFDEVDKIFKALLPTPGPTPQPKTGPPPTETPSQNDDLFVLDSKTKRLLKNVGDQKEIIAENVKGFRISKNENKLVWWTSNEFWVLWLNDQNYQPFHKSGDKELITRFVQSIQNVAWFRGEDHLVLELETYDSKGRPYFIYKVTEIDKRGGLNIIEL